MVLRTYFPLTDVLDLAADMAGWTDTAIARDAHKSETPTPAWQPHTDIAEDKNAYFIRMEIPGVEKDDLTLRLEDDQLIISGRKDPRAAGKALMFHAREIRGGEFEKKFKINGHIRRDKIDAKLANGLLEVVLPKAAKATAREIKVEAR